MTTVVPAGVLGHSTFLTSFASQNEPSVTIDCGGHELDTADTVWTTSGVVRAAVEVAPSPGRLLVDVRTGSDG